MSKMHRKELRGLNRLARLALLVIVAAFALMARPALAQDDPNFAAINDPLDGEYEIFTVDDLLIAVTKPLASDTQSEINNYVLETENDMLSSQVKRTVATPPCYLTSGRQPQQTRAGRFFSLPHDVIVTLSPTNNAQGANCATTDGSPNMALYVQDVQTTDNIASLFSLSAVNTAVAMADFNQDGFEDLLVMSDSQLGVATATDVNDKQQGMTFGPFTALAAANLAARTDPTSGDFNGDGLVDVAWAALDDTVHFATVCPGDVAGTICAGAAAWTVIVDPLQSHATGIHVPPSPVCAHSDSVGFNFGVGLSAGDFALDGSDGLVTINLEADPASTPPGFCIFAAYWWEFDGAFSTRKVDQISVGPIPQQSYPLDIYALTAKLNWFGDSEQVVVGVGAQNYMESGPCESRWKRMENILVLSFDDSKISLARFNNPDTACVGGPFYSLAYPWLNGIAVGRFAAIPDDPNTESDFNLQIATVLNSGVVHIYSVDAPTDYTPKLVTTTTLDPGLGLNLRDFEGPPNRINWLVSGDLQGRSMRLGPPVVVRVNSHSQPSVILGAPPMHVDYILPDPSTSSTSEIVNFTAAPDSYNSQYTVSDSSDKQSSDTSTSSYAYAYSESAEEKFKFKVPFVSSISGDFKQAWKQTGESTGSDYQFDENEFAFNAGTTTGFGDQVWFSSSDFNVYYYPVLGQTVCPNDQTSCTPEEEQPLYVSFSGPSDAVGVVPASGSTLEWYQPVHQPGQIFSYPWSKQQLEARFSGASLLTSGTPEPFYTDDSGTSETLNWTQNSGASQTTGSSNSHSFETDNSFTAGGIPDGGSGVSVTGSYDYNNSTATSSLNTSSSNVGQSKGIGIVKPKFPTAYASLYQYLVRPFIFGQSPNAGTVQELDLGTNIQTSGPLRSAYVADPTNAQAGSWWSSDVSPYTQFIDVALNHPQRWNIVTSGSGLACVVGDCAIPYTPLPDNLWNSQFYHMRGLLVTVGGTSGPQRAQAVVGDDVFLQARVYNYSLKDMPAGSTIKVQFYRQAINGTTPAGAGVLIAEKTANPLPGFNSAMNPEAPNWTTVQTSFEATADMGSKNFIFWVVVWAEDSQGNLIVELPGHGLTGRPGTLAAIGDAPLETTDITTAVGDPLTTSFSNNVGMFKQKFYIAPAASVVAATLRPPSGTLSVENGEVTEAPQYGKGRYVVSADIRATDGPVEAVAVLFFDGDPETKTVRLHDVDMLPFVSQEQSDAVSIPFQPVGCGAKKLVIVARSGASNSGRQVLTFNVPCPPLLFPIIQN